MKLIDYIPTGSDPGQCHDIGRRCRLLPHSQRHGVCGECWACAQLDAPSRADLIEERPRHEKPVGDPLWAGVHQQLNAGW